MRNGVLGSLLRETIVNHGNRRRLDSDAHTHANHRRSRKIQEIKERFQDNQHDHRFYSQIIQDIQPSIKVYSITIVIFLTNRLNGIF